MGKQTLHSAIAEFHKKGWAGISQPNLFPIYLIPNLIIAMTRSIVSSHKKRTPNSPRKLDLWARIFVGRLNRDEDCVFTATFLFWRVVIDPSRLEVAQGTACAVRGKNQPHHPNTPLPVMGKCLKNADSKLTIKNCERRSFANN